LLVTCIRTVNFPHQSQQFNWNIFKSPQLHFFRKINRLKLLVKIFAMWFVLFVMWPILSLNLLYVLIYKAFTNFIKQKRLDKKKWSCGDLKIFQLNCWDWWGKFTVLMQVTNKIYELKLYLVLLTIKGGGAIYSGSSHWFYGDMSNMGTNHEF
jgi:hypothetical protein